jgi:hypothetical protein
LLVVAVVGRELTQVVHGLEVVGVQAGIVHPLGLAEVVVEQRVL